MNKLLIVEDEKMIRQGLKVIAQRAPIEIGEIIECKNGEEALEVLKTTEIDVMFTDIRMPKKDGLTLVKDIQALPHRPQIVMISGYDDFSYAVEALRYGAKEYILKPVEREKINDILVKLDKVVQEEHEALNKESNMKEIGYQQLKYMLLNPHITADEIEKIKETLHSLFVEKPYSICCVNQEERIEARLSEVIQLDNIDLNTVFIVESTFKEKFIEAYLKDKTVGISKEYATLNQLKEAYIEAVEARKHAYLTEAKVVEYKNVCSNQHTNLTEEEILKAVQLVGTSKFEQVSIFIETLFEKARQAEVDSKTFEAILTQLLQKVALTYKSVVDQEEERYKKLVLLYSYNTAKAYEADLLAWLEEINSKIVTEHEAYRNKQKLQEAIAYIQLNYNKELNMAVVSNHISMNYSFFSQIFKEYTGMNFVNYLKEIRINKAKKLLTTTDEKIAEISLRVGYENEKHFMKVFKGVLGVSPTEYRKNAQINR